MNEVRKVFEVVISDKSYDVFDIPSREHAGLNDTVKTWWVYYADRLPDGMLPPIDSDSFKPLDSSINRMLWEFRIKQRNYSKEKWGDTDFRNSTRVEMLCNNKPVFSFSTTGTSSGLAFAMGKIQYLQVALAEHSYNFFETESENNRKIFFLGLPAFVRPSTEPGEIGIVPDYSQIPKEVWWKEFKNRNECLTKVPEEDDIDIFEEDYGSDFINWGSALSDGKIDWFRK
jgi:hypothetical protein